MQLQQKQENIKAKLTSACLSFQSLKKVINRSLDPSLNIYTKGLEEKLQRLFLLREASDAMDTKCKISSNAKLRSCEISLIGIDKFNMVMSQKLITDPFIKFLRTKIEENNGDTVIVLQGKMMLLLRYKVILEYSKVHSSDDKLLFDCDRLNKLEDEIKLIFFVK